MLEVDRCQPRSAGSHTKHVEQMNSKGQEMDNQMCHDDELMFDRGPGLCRRFDS